MATPSIGEAEFLFGACPACGKRVLTHTDFGPAGNELRRCLHCDTIITTSELEAATGSELEANGYVVIEARTCGGGGGCGGGTCGVLKG
jgi:hypothetical protein